MNDNDDEMNFDLFADETSETYQSPVILQGGVSPEELSKMVQGWQEDILEGLFSSFFMSQKTTVQVTNDNRKAILESFLLNLDRPFSQKVSIGVLDFYLANPIELLEAKSNISKSLSHGVSLEGGRFNRDVEKSNRVAEQILACYPGIPNVYSSQNRDLFPVGHRAEITFVITWPEACGILTFLGWD